GYSIDLAPFNYDQDKQDVPPDENGHGGQTLSQENQKKVPVTPPRNQKKGPVTTSQNQKKGPTTTSQNRKIVPITKSESEKSSEHAPLNQKKVPTFKYSKESVSIVNKEQEGIEQNSIVVNAKVSIKELLSIAGLSGMGLSKLCDRQPPLDRQQVKAVILYAEANELGPGYIYNHLEQNGCVVDEEFLQFAALGDEGLALFQEAVRELKINGTLVAEIRTPIPESAFDLFARFAEVFT
ncbi:MAG: hypothetical protein GY797_29080, partial [Deltaproteobacteria bacterium]|nr:hypothetical protein [Deltaproteobacteria bacterium]